MNRITRIGWGWAVALLLSCTGVFAAAYEGRHLSSTGSAAVTLGSSLSITSRIQNTGTATWNSYSQPGWIHQVQQMSWNSGFSRTYYVWQSVASGALDGHTITLSANDMPSKTGVYSFVFVTYYPKDSYSGQYTIMTNSPKTVYFTVTAAQSAPLPAGLAIVQLQPGQLTISVTNTMAGHTNYVLRASSLRSNDWSTIDSFVCARGYTNRMITLSNEWNGGFFKVVTR